MESTQVKKLKLNATNIKTVLISGNRSLKKLRSEENNLVAKQKQKLQIKRKEAVVEGKPLPGSGLAKNIGSKITAPARGLFDRVKDFIGIVLLGVLVNNIPKIIKKIKKLTKYHRFRRPEIINKYLLPGAPRAEINKCLSQPPQTYEK